MPTMLPFPLSHAFVRRKKTHKKYINRMRLLRRKCYNCELDRFGSICKKKFKIKGFGTKVIRHCKKFIKIDKVKDMIERKDW